MFKFLAILLTAFYSLFAQEIDLAPYENSLYSQNGEDGVLSKIFQLIKPSSKFCVELGAYDGITTSNTYLLRQQGWDCLLFDRMYELPQLHLHKEFITAENINLLFNKYHVPPNLDLLSIDISYNDFYVWKALDKKYQPVVVVIEYNATHLPTEDKIAKYHPFYAGDGTNYYGASILSLYRLGRSKGYSLVYAEKAGENLFFVRDDILIANNLTFKDMNNVEKIYRAPNGRHVNDWKNRPYISSTEILK